MSDRPHIVIIMTDQQRADCLGCAGHRQLRTPHLDRIAREGARFSQAITVAPLCMPARASFATALYPHDHGVWTNSGELAPEEDTLFQMLQRQGYSTALVGKAHYYEHREGMDLREREGEMHGRGFAYVHEAPGPAGAAITSSYVTDEWSRKGLWNTFKQDLIDRVEQGDWIVRPSPLRVEDHLDTYIGRRAVEFIDAYRASQPLALFVGFAGPHEPWDAPGEYATMYAPGETPPPIPIPAVNESLPPEVRQKRVFRVRPPRALAMIPEIRANYYGKITLIDDQIGAVLGALERRGLLDDTLVVFLADHGEMLGDHGRFRKGTFHESSIRIPLLMRWPARIAAGTVSDALVESIDVVHAILEAAVCPPSSGRAGRSLWPALQRDAAVDWKEQLCEIRHSSENQTMLRTRDSKLAVDGEGRVFMLYDLQRDPQEQRNLAGDPAAAHLADDLHARLRTRVEHSRFRD